MSSSKDGGRMAPDLEIVGDRVTVHPTGFTGGPDVEDGITERKLVRNMARFRENPFEFMREVSLFVSGTGWRAYDNAIGQPIFYPGFSEKMKSNIMSNPLLKAKITELAELRSQVEEEQGLLDSAQSKDGDGHRIRRKNEIESNLKEVVDTMMENMICKMESKNFVRGAYYLCTQLLTRAYHQGIHVSSEEVLRLRSVAQTAAKNKQSIVFLPCHRSHVDYVSLQLICYRLGIGLPVVVAGDNLNIPLLGNFLQHTGAMWIRRTFGDDPLYHTLVQAYVDTLLKEGFNFECFVEGGRSRTGKLLTPKFGILSFILDSVASGRIEDAIICPVSTQYDKVIETESYISELLGQPKQKENLLDFLNSSSVLSLKLGRVDVRFHEPWSLKAFVAEQCARIYDLPNNSAIQVKMGVAERGRLLRTLGYRVLSDINGVSVVMPTALVGTVLLTLRGRGVGKTELVRRVNWLCERVRVKGGRVAHFYRAPTEQVVDRAIEVLGPKLVGEISGLAEPTFYAVDRFQLSFYRNMTIHLFITEALVSAAMYARVKQGGGPMNQRSSYDDLVTQVTFLSQLFRGEFIFPPDGLAHNLEKTLNGLERDNVIKITRDSSGVPTYIELSFEERQCGRENFDFYCFLIWPFIEASWLGAVSLMGLTPPLNNGPKSAWVDLKKAQDSAQLLGKTLYHQGDLSYFEAVNKETLKNAFLRFEEERIIVVARPKNKGTTTGQAATMRLAPSWMPERDPSTGKILARGKLWDFMSLIAQSRREGKNRRDGATVSSRVLTMTDAVGREVFKVASAAEESSAENLDMSTKQLRRTALGASSKL
ncbi:male sterility protein [Histoplasma capsulatum var. duboisii H88]|uniref:Male sterility protein n=1 Tax=Ajellomyces capsulatus (strain H88) TaxID=544711 RepID=A0A8A1LI16_AJEC8|nr:male sterility protein [Histoplasma capsulatum var. duboisii H88]